MFTDRLVGRLPFFNAKARSVPSVVEEAPKTSYQENSPIKTITGAETPISAMIHESFNSFSLAAGDLTPLPDQDSRQFYFCGTNPEGQSKFWLDPKKWNVTLNEFADFAETAGANNVKLAIEQHEPAVTSLDREWVIVRPVRVRETHKIKETEYVYGITEEGRVSFGNTKIGFIDLGYLNPGRIREEQIAKLKEMLTHPTY